MAIYHPHFTGLWENTTLAIRLTDKSAPLITKVAIALVRNLISDKYTRTESGGQCDYVLVSSCIVEYNQLMALSPLMVRETGAALTQID